jgi:two-component system, chemotaxis family, sensor kinase CheA
MVRSPERGAAESDDRGGCETARFEDVSAAFNAVAAQIARAEADDSQRLCEAVEALRALTTQPVMWASLRATLSVVADRLDTIAAGKSSKRDEDFQETCRMMDRAAEMLHERMIGMPKSAVEPAEEPGRPVESHDEPSPLPAPVPSPAQPAPQSAKAWILPADADTALLADFVQECREYVEGAEAALLELETDPERIEAINTVFRAFHTIKGTSGFLGITMITELAHKAENLLSRVRDKEIRCTGGYADLALRSVDAMKLLIEGVQQALSGGAASKPDDYDDLIRTLIDPEAAGVNDGDVARPAESAGGMEPPVTEPKTVQIPIAPVEACRDKAPASVAAVQEKVPPTQDGAKAQRGQQTVARRAEEGGEASTRVRTDRLDRLIDMVGELVIAHSMVAQDDGVATGQRPDLLRKVSHAGKIVRELQDLSMSMRMVPLKPTFLKMTRLVRDLAHKGGRQVEFVTAGEDTEIDRNMVDVLADPLVHMIRNAVDHGIEPPEQREIAGKPARGRVSLSAFHAGGNVVVELRDDGKGLDREKIARKAIERGLIETDKGMSDGEVYNLIFEPGFSTAEKVTEVSGRGVGMDVVRRAILSLRGRIEIQSEVGVGTTFSLKLPLTLAVTDGMLVRVGTQRFIVPTVSIHISFRPERAAVSTVTGRGEMVLLRGALVPIVRLHKIFKIAGASEDPSSALLVVIEDGDRRSALMIDELLGQQQVVAKSLGDGVGKIPGVAGGAILGDGRVGLILDPAGVAQLYREGPGAGASALLERMAA